MKFRKFLSFILAVVVSMLPVNQPLALAAGSDEQGFIGSKKILESLTSTPANAQTGDEFSKPDKDDMLGGGVTDYNTWIGDIRVNSENQNDVLKDGKKNIVYQPADGTERAKLTLNNLNISIDMKDHACAWYPFIYADEDIDLNLQGENVINIKSSKTYVDTFDLCGMFILGSLNCSGGGSLTINIDAENPNEKLSRLEGIVCSCDSSFKDVKVKLNIEGFAKEVYAIDAVYVKADKDTLNIINSSIDITSWVGYNTQLGDPSGKEIVLMRIGNKCNINSSDINLNLKEREGIKKDGANLVGLDVKEENGKLDVSGKTSISINSSEFSILAKEIYIKDNYKIDLTGSTVFFEGTAMSGIELGNNGSYFISRAEDATLVCNSLIGGGKGDFIAPDGAVVLAGDSEELAQPVAKEEFKNLFKYEIDPDSYHGYKFIKVAYPSNITFNANGGSGEMPGIQILSGTKYPLPACAFTPPSGKKFKAWEIGKVEYTPGKSIIIEGDTVINTVWTDKSSGGGGSGGSGGGSGGGGSGGGAGGSGPGKSSGTWMQDGTGWWYKNSDGSYPKSGWQQIDSVWYAFNDAGYMITGWYLSEGSWYYLNSNGSMATGWIELGGKWYYMSSSGVMSTGWIESGGKWYYLEPTGREGNPQGSMYTSEITPDGFTVNALGEWVG